MSDPNADDAALASDPGEAFLTLSHELRLEILLALWEAPDHALSFSSLREAVGERDSGKFSYHLSKLEPQFVGQSGDRYELQYPGHRILDAIQSGVFHERVTVGPVDLDTDCRGCGSTLQFEYGADYIARVGCADCGERTLEWPFDPGGVADRTPIEVAEAFDRRTRRTWTCALDGVCPFCAGHVDRTVADGVTSQGLCIGVLEEIDRYDEYFARDHAAVVSLDCRQCSFYSFVPVGVVVLTRPRVLGTLADRGVDVRATPLWDLEFVVDADAVRVHSEAPLEIAVRTEAGTEPTTVLVDGGLDVSLLE